MTTRSATATKPESLEAYLTLDHERLENTFTELLQAFRRGDRDHLRDTWTRFDSGILGHLGAEERFMLPLFRATHPDAARTIEVQHARFRRVLAELGVGVDLGLVNFEVANEFIGALRNHARMEEAFLYRWAERELPADAQAHVREGIESRRDREGR
jgi:hemerythrin-like domain-containing protein